MRNAIFTAKDSGNIFYITYTPELQNYWETNAKLLMEMNRLAKAHSATLIITVIPARVQIDDSTWKQFAAREDVERTRPNDLLKELVQSQDIMLVDPYGAFAASNATLFLPVDTHLNPAGHLLLAKQIFMALQK